MRMSSHKEHAMCLLIPKIQPLLIAASLFYHSVHRLVDRNGEAMTMLKARCALVVLAALLLLSTLAEAKGPQLPPPDPERGSIGVTIRAIPPAKFGKMTAVQVYFVRPAEGGDVLDAEFVISSNYSDKKQVYFLNAKPGCYVAVAARLKGSGMGLLYEAFFPWRCYRKWKSWWSLANWSSWASFC